jgi:hypothetical protein
MNTDKHGFAEDSAQTAFTHRVSPSTHFHIRVHPGPSVVEKPQLPDLG